MDIEQLLTPRQVQEIMQISRKSIDRMCAEGLLIPLKLRGTVRFRPEDVRRVLDIAAEANDPVILTCECSGPCECYRRQ